MERLVNLVTSLNFAWIKYYRKFPYGWSVYRSENPQEAILIKLTHSLLMLQAFLTTTKWNIYLRNDFNDKLFLCFMYTMDN